ncbi:MAG: hypothetical protein AAF219_02995 [Myxococcota bacterium]
MIVLIALMTTSVFGDDPACPSGEVIAKPRFDYRDRIVVFEHGYDAQWAMCASEKRGEGKLRLTLKRSDGVILKQEDIDPRYSLHPGSRMSIIGKAFPSTLCKDLPRVTPVLRGPPGAQTLQVPVTVTAELVATGGLEPLATRARTTAYCAGCEYASYKNTISGNIDGQRLELRGKADSEWIRCVRRGKSSLELRVFVGDERAQALKALRPAMVVKKLERYFKSGNKDSRFMHTIDLKRLCRNGRRWVVWEFGGRGELKRIGGGGRSVQELKCR